MTDTQLNQKVEAIINNAAAEIAAQTGYEVIVSYRKKPAPRVPTKKEGILYGFIFSCCNAVETPYQLVENHEHTNEDLVSVRQAIIVAVRTKYKENAAWGKVAELMGYENASGAIKSYTKGMAYQKNNDKIFAKYYNLLKPLL